MCCSQGPKFREIMRPFVGESLFNSDDALWHTLRRDIAPQFSPANLREYFGGVFAANIPHLLDAIARGAKGAFYCRFAVRGAMLWDANVSSPRMRTAGGQYFDIQMIFSQFTLDSTCEIACGVRVGSLHQVRGCLSEVFSQQRER